MARKSPQTTGGFKRRSRDERGVVLVLAAILLPLVFLGMAALAIDVGSFDQARQQAQATADAAALAGAHDLPSNATTAKADAVSYGAKNMASATVSPTSPYNSSSSEIQVTVTASTPSFFGKIFGITSANVSATAVAAVTGAPASCSTPGSSCDAFFAMDSSCSGAGLVFGGGTHITGGVASNGALNVGGGGSSFGPTTYGAGCTVSPTGYAGQNNTFTSGPTGQAPTLTWPIDYGTYDFPSCTGTACTGPLGTPSYCTQASTSTSTWTLVSYSPSTLTSGQIYCDVGSGTPGDPTGKTAGDTAWNGAISAAQSGGTMIASTFVAGSVSIGGGSDLEACGYAVAGYTTSGATACSAAIPAPRTTNYPLAYVVGTVTPFSTPGGGVNLLGDVFAPNGAITFVGGGNTTTFMEAQDVTASGGGNTGDGPSDTGTTTPSGGTVSLVG